MSIEITSPEVELLLLCARTTISPAEAERMATICAAPLDLEYLFRTASRQGITQLLYRNLNAFSPSALPAEAMAQLQQRFQANARHGMMLTGELLKITAIFEVHGIPSIPYKGPTLAMMLYGNVALRKFQDVDLLVHPEDLLRARDLLMAEGYTPQFDLSGARAESFLHAQHQLVMTRESDGSIVELHWEISPRYFSFPFHAAQLWERLEQRSMLGRSLPTLALDDILLILSAHGAKHNWERLAWICDIAELVHRYGRDIDWNNLLDRAAKLGSERMVMLALLLAADLLGAELPAAVTVAMQNHAGLDELVLDVFERIFAGDDYRAEVMKRSRFHLRTRERLSDRILYGIRRATTPTMEDWKQLQLPPMLAWSLPFLRPLRLTLKHGRRLLLGRF
jgi:hypothetical protein